ncbi:MAG: DNA-binding protein WhiA [Synergistota bacterium]|nr:DNA-binding protein WhiA [Synergistota bacterium]
MDAGTRLASEMWDDWTTAPVGSGAAAPDEIRGLIDGLSKARENDEEVVFSSVRLWVFRRLKTLWEEWEVSKPYEFASLLSIPPTMKGRVHIRLPRQILESLEAEPPPRSTAWLKGLWGSCGSLYLPRTGYYLCFRVPSCSTEGRAAHILASRGFSIGRRRVQGSYEITMRDQQQIVDMLAGFNMFKTTLILEEKAIFRELRNKANKLVNCDASNIRKSLEASARQIEIARYALASPSYRSMPPAWRALISARLANPSITLEELGRILSPPVSKSTVKYRWKKIADSLETP